MTIFFIVILLLFGITLIVLEVLLLPGLIAGILGGVFMLMGVAWTWQIYGSTAAIVTALGAGALLATALVLSLRSGVWGRFSLKEQLEGKMNTIDPEKVKAGDRGAAISSLRPMGTVRVNGEKYEAQSEGALIPPNYPVEVIRIDGYKLIVKPVV